MKLRIGILSLCLCLALAAAELPKAPLLLPPDDRFKADILLIVAHPDDDTAIGAYLAKASVDEHKRIAVIYCTSGGSGGNSVGFEAGNALGQMRTMEARRALQSLGIENVWFLGQRDVPSQNVLWSLDAWNHGLMSDEIVRLVRLTRLDVILTWLPEYVVGENHGDHQAAGVLATEAFDSAGDPLRFPEQVIPARNREGMSNLTEGLHPWQPQKIYYMTDAFEFFNSYWHDNRVFSPFRKNFEEGSGPAYSPAEISPSRHVSYAKLAAEQQSYYLTQGGDIGVDALKKNNFRDFEFPVHLIFGKSVVGGSITGDVFENVKTGKVPYQPVSGFKPQGCGRLSLELGGSWKFYRELWKAHDLQHLANLLPIPEVTAGFGETLHVPLLLKNGTETSETITLTSALPTGWTDKTKFAVYPVGPGETYPVEAEIAAPATGNRRWEKISWKAAAGGRQIGTVPMRVYLGKSSGLPQ